MIAGWSKLQCSDNPGAGAFPFSRSSPNDKNLSLCRSYGDKLSLRDTASSLPVKTALGQSLVGAFISATEILNGRVHSPALKNVLGFPAFGIYDDLELLQPCHAITHDETLQLLSRDGVSHVGNAQSQDTAPFTSSRGKIHGNVSIFMRGTFQSADSRHAGQRSTLRSNDVVQSEEDFLLQEARLKSLRGKTESDESIQIYASEDHKAKTVNVTVKQDHTREPFVCQAEHLQTSGIQSVKETLTFSSHSSLGWVAAAASLLIAGALFLTFQARQEKSKRSSLKRRILKSQWYGSHGSQSWGHRNFQTTVRQFPKFGIIGVDDSDKKLLSFPSDRIVPSAALFKTDCTRRSDTTNSCLSTPQKAEGQRSDTTNSCLSTPQKAEGQLIRQTIQGSKAIPARQFRLIKPQHNESLVGKVSAHGKGTGLETRKHLVSSDDHDDTWKGWRLSSLSQPRSLSLNDKESGRGTPYKRRSGKRLDGRSLPDLIQENVSVGELKQKTSIIDASRKFGHGQWEKDDELDLDARIQKLYHTIQAVEQHRRAAMLALEEEKQRSMALEEEVLKQKEESAMLGEEVRVLKESHNTLLTQLRKKYSTTAAARTAADLVYQDWERRVAAE